MELKPDQPSGPSDPRKQTGAAGGPGGGLHIDDDWKAQARAEKQRLAEQAKSAGAVDDAAGGATGAAGPAAAAGTAGGARRQGQIPPASFHTLVSSLASQALLFMGAVPDPRTGQRIAHLDLARHNIDLLGVLQEKCKGNLSDDEDKLLSTTVYELRQAYIQVVTAAREQARGG